jgi:hypothetical protein
VAAEVTTPIADKDGWTERMQYTYQTSPNEKRDVGADVRKANDIWTVTIYDVGQDIGEKRAAQIGLIYGKLLPKGTNRESFTGKKANTLDEARLAELRKFVESSMKLTGVPEFRSPFIKTVASCWRKDSACASSASPRRPTPTPST